MNLNKKSCGILMTKRTYKVKQVKLIQLATSKDCVFSTRSRSTELTINRTQKTKSEDVESN